MHSTYVFRNPNKFCPHSLQISSHTWTKESHGLFDYELKDVLTVKHDAVNHTSILRKDLNVVFDYNKQKTDISGTELEKTPKVDDLIAKISHSENKHWWIYH